MKNGVIARLRLVLVIYLMVCAGPLQAEDIVPLRVEIEGVEGRLLDNVRVFLGVIPLDGQPITNEARLRWLHDRTEGEIRRALQPFGYYRPSIETELERTPQAWVAHYRIEPGPPIRITEMDVQVRGEGRQDPAFQRTLALLPLKEGNVLSHPLYEDIKRAFQELAAERGYFDARLVTSEIRVDLEEYQAAIVLHFDTGDRYRLGEVSFHQDILSPRFLHRFVRFEPGDPYRIASLLDLQTALIDSAYFRRVEVDASPDRAVNNVIPVEVHLDPLPRHRYIFGLGFGTDTGLRARVGVEGRWINRWGHRYRADILASQIRLGVSGEYIIPGIRPRTDRFVIRGSLFDEEEVKDTRTAILGLSYQRQIGLWLRNISLDWQRETFRIGPETRTTTLLMPSIVGTRLDFDDRLRVSRGSRLVLELRGAYEDLLSDVSFLQAVARGKWIRPLTENGRILLRGELGTSLVSEFDDLPSTVRFFAGGDRSVRGFGLDRIGPRDVEGNIIGARHLIVGSVEYDHRIRENWSVAVFVDSGDAFNASPSLKTGVGFGVRWHSPIGPVRVDLASGLVDPGDTIRLHLTIGPDL